MRRGKGRKKFGRIGIGGGGVEDVGGSGIGIILGRHRGIGYRENEDRELEGYT